MNKPKISIEHLRGVKVNIKCKEDRMKFQGKCFDLGITWKKGIVGFFELHCPLYYIDENLQLIAVFLYSAFYQKKYREISVDDVLSLK